MQGEAPKGQHRWQEIVASRVAAGETEGLARDFVFQRFEAIHEEAIRQQEEREPSGDAGSR